MNTNRTTGPSSKPVEVHTRTRRITLDTREAHAALAPSSHGKGRDQPRAEQRNGLCAGL